jgi:hypothetical protein
VYQCNGCHLINDAVDPKKLPAAPSGGFFGYLSAYFVKIGDCPDPPTDVSGRTHPASICDRNSSPGKNLSCSVHRVGFPVVNTLFTPGID